MKLLRYGPKGQEKPGCLDADGNIRDLSMTVTDFTGNSISLAEMDRLKGLNPEALPLVEGNPRIGSCLADVPNFYCIGLNYAKHAAEAGMDTPKEPILFSKATSALSGPFDPVLIPRNSTKTDWEVELGVVIGKTASYVSERAFQIERGGQWIKGKSAPSFGPIGPYLVTADEISDPQNLSLSLRLNGDVMQNSSTSDMVFTVAEIISHMSQFMELRPGDIIATGTPEGVGMGFKPPRFLKAGDVMELEVLNA
ncbi:MAG: fumarylacetoacetate hydrolase family protein [Alphaproteobacteria bacterium]